MRAGALDRRIAIAEKTSTQNSVGEEVVSWITIATVWAEKIENVGQERFQSAQFIGKAACSFKFRWSELTRGVTAIHRIVFDGRAFDIQAVREWGRREGIIVDCTARSEEPLAPLSPPPPPPPPAGFSLDFSQASNSGYLALLEDI